MYDCITHVPLVVFFRLSTCTIPSSRYRLSYQIARWLRFREKRGATECIEKQVDLNSTEYKCIIIALVVNMENFLSVYGGNIQIPSANAYGYNDNVSSSQGDSLSPVASTSSASQHTSPDDSEQQRTGLQAASQQQQQHKQRQQQQPQQNKESIPPTTAAKKLPRRSCDPCRLRRVRCVRSAKSNDCEKCLAMGIK